MAKEQYAARPAEKSRPKHDISLSRDDRLDQPGIFVRAIFEVGILKQRDRPPRVRNSGSERRPFARVPLLQNDSDTVLRIGRVCGRKLADLRRCVVGGPIVNDDDFLLDRHLRNPFEQRTDGHPFVEDRHDNGEHRTLNSKHNKDL